MYVEHSCKIYLPVVAQESSLAFAACFQLVAFVQKTVAFDLESWACVLDNLDDIGCLDDLELPLVFGTFDPFDEGACLLLVLGLIARSC